VLDCENTGGSSTVLPLSAMEECVACAAGLHPIYIISMGGVERLGIGENTTTAWSAYAEDATRMDMRSGSDV
jgi:hypothetical protein